MRSQWDKPILDLEAKVEKLEEENEMLRKALIKYGEHLDGCALCKEPPMSNCNCGFAEALEGEGGKR